MNDKNAAIKKVLNVGGNTKLIPLPSCFDGWQHDLLDIDPAVNPDILCDARELWKLPPRQYDAIHCSHNLEHYFAHEVPKVLKGFSLLLKQDGFAYIRVPDICETMKVVIENNLELDEQLYMSSSGPIAPLDVFFGFRKQIEQSENDYFAHKTGFSRNLLSKLLKNNGFPIVYIVENQLNLEIIAFAFKNEPSEDIEKLGLRLLNSAN